MVLFNDTFKYRVFILDPNGLYLTPHPQFLSHRKKQKKSRKIHFHGMQEKKENAKKLKIVDSRSK